MIAGQAAFFRDHGHEVTISCEKLGSDSLAALAGSSVHRLAKPARWFMSRTRKDSIYAKRASEFRRRGAGVIIDHGRSIEHADIGYVHNFRTAELADRLGGFLPQQDRMLAEWGDAERRTVIVVNSQMVRQGLVELAGVPDDKIAVVYPGYDPRRFNLPNRDRLRAGSRKDLGVDDGEILLGMVTSGDFHKRGLERFLDCVAAVRAEHERVRVLVAGGSRRPRLMADHPLSRRGIALYRPSILDPERYFAALDLFLYPARYEEFGIVVLEAMAMGIPIVTSTAVGASELVRRASSELVVTAPGDDVDAYCDRVVGAMRMESAQRSSLAGALSEVAERHTEDRHNNTIRELLPGQADLA